MGDGRRVVRAYGGGRHVHCCQWAVYWQALECEVAGR